MRLIDADKLKNSIRGTILTIEQRDMFFALIDAQPREGYEEFEMKGAMEKANYWYKKCETYEQTLIKLAVMLGEKHETD